MGWLLIGCPPAVPAPAGSEVQDRAEDDAPLRPANVRLSTERFFDAEPFTAVDPKDANHLVAGWMHSHARATMDIQLSASFDGGRTWTKPATMPHRAGPNTAADISLEFDREGAAHAVWVDFAASGGPYSPMTSAMVVHSREEGPGRGWSRPSVIRRHDETSDWAIDRPWVVIDRSGGPRDGWLYVVNNSVHTNHAPPHLIHVKRSSDGGATWSPDIRVDAPPFATGNAPVSFAVASVGPDGTLYTVYLTWRTPACLGL